MTNEAGVVRSISWRDLCPWTILFRLYRLSLSVQFLLLSFIGLWAVSFGWTALSTIVLSRSSLENPATRQFVEVMTQWPEPSVFFLGRPPTRQTQPAALLLAAETTEPPRNGANNGTNASPAPVGPSTEEPPDNAAMPRDEVAAGEFAASDAKLRDLPFAAASLAERWHGPLSKTPMYGLVEPFRRVFEPSASWNEFVFFLLGSLWSLVVWSWIGGALTRAAAIRLGRDERCGFRDSLEFAGRKLGSYLAAPLFPLVAIVLLGLPMIILGLLMRTDVGVALSGILWVPVLLSAFVMSLFAIGVLFGWPLMWGAISTEGSDAFDALSRSYAYTFQRPLQYLAYALAALVLGGLGWLLVGLFCDAVIQFSMFAIGVGSGNDRLGLLVNVLHGQTESPSVLFTFGAAMIGLLNRSVYAVQVAFGYSYLWAAAAAIYLLLRRDADHTEMDDVFVEEQDNIAYGLPPLPVDERGVPSVAAEPSETQPAKPPKDAPRSEANESKTSRSAPIGTPGTAAPAEGDRDAKPSIAPGDLESRDDTAH